MSVPEPLPASVVGFLRTYVGSLEKLMLLLLVHRAPSGTVSVPIAARLVNIPVSQARCIAGELAERGLLRVTTKEQIELGAPRIEDRMALSDLAFWYMRDRALVLDALLALARPAR
jgi:hypothetical protein